MATLLELKTIEMDSSADPATATAEQLQAIELRRRIEAELWVRAADYLSGNLPADNRESVEAIALAQRVVSGSSALAGQMLRLLLAANESFTKAQILGATDATIKSNVGTVLTLLARGLHPGR